MAQKWRERIFLSKNGVFFPFFIFFEYFSIFAPILLTKIILRMKNSSELNRKKHIK
jgi:hypothetical protein